MTPRRLRSLLGGATLCATLMVGLPSVAWADDPQAPPAQAGSSKVVVERVENTFIFAPDFKYTQVDGYDGFLLGGYSGVLLDKKFFLGGGGYWMVNGDDIHELAYGGVIAEWHLLRGHSASVTVGGLGGFGVGRVAYAYTRNDYPGVPMPHHAYGGYGYWGYGDYGFMVGEPQVSVVFRISDGASVAANVGYRFVAFANGQEDHFRGLTGGVSIRFGATR